MRLGRQSDGSHQCCLVALPALPAELGPCSEHAPLIYLCDLHAPVEQVLGADVVLVLADIVQQAAEGHELRDELHRGRQTDAQEAAHVRIVHTGHHVGFLGGEEERAHQKGSPPWLKEQADRPFPGTEVEHDFKFGSVRVWRTRVPVKRLVQWAFPWGLLPARLWSGSMGDGVL